jgi:hypothetical protein
MGEQAIALGCPVHNVSDIETGKIPPSNEYIEAFTRWLNLEGSQAEALKTSLVISSYILAPRN